MRQHFAITSALLVSLLALDASAEEVFCDPENPACQSAEEEDAPEDPPEETASPSPGEDTTGADGGELLLCDPENPACQSQEEDSSGEGEDKKPRVIFNDPSGQVSAPPSNADFELTWGSALSVDTRWQGEGEDIAELGGAVNAGIGMELDPTLSVELELQLRYWTGGQRREDGPNLLFNAANPRADFEVRSGISALAWRPGRFSLRAGMLQTDWSATRLVRPANVINPTDRRSFGMVGPARSDGTLSQLTAELGWTAPRWSLTGIVVPFFEPDRVVLFGRDVALAGPRSPLSSSFPLAQLLQQFIDPSVYEEAQMLLWAPTQPDERPRSASLGGRFASTVLNTDLGVSYFWGWDRTPYIELDEGAAELLSLLANDEQIFVDFNFTGFIRRNPRAGILARELSVKAENGEEVIVQEFDRRHTLMVDFARYIGPIGVRADAVFSPAQNFSTETLGTIRRPSLSGALGLSYERIEGERILALTLEGFWVEPFGRTSGVTEFFVPEERRGEEGERAAIIGQRLYGVAGGVAWDIPVIETNLQLGGVYNISSRDMIANVALRRGITDSVWATLGASVFEGPPPSERLTLGGLFDINDHVYLGFDGVF